MRPMSTTLDVPWPELQDSLRAFIARRVRNHADVDDLVQRVLLQIVTGLGSLRDAERIHAWIYRTARNAIVDYYRSPTSRREVASGGAIDLASTNETDRATPIETDERAALRELAGCLAPMIRQLPPAYQEAVRMADLEGLSQADAATRAGVSVSGMKSRVQRGRRQLRAIVEACCRVSLDRRGTITSYAPRRAEACACAKAGTVAATTDAVEDRIHGNNTCKKARGGSADPDDWRGGRPRSRPGAVLILPSQLA